MTIDEGYIKYNLDWTPGPAGHAEEVRDLDKWRRPLFAAELIGHYDNLGVGYGNISRRCGAAGQFLISGTQTGHLPITDERHYALVTGIDIDANRVSCQGPVEASSEAMTHAAIYALDEKIGAVVHVHSERLWRRYRGELPTTDANVAYGTPQMAHEFERLYVETEFDRVGIAVMAGHDEGLVSFGTTLESAATKMLSLAGRPGFAPA